MGVWSYLTTYYNPPGSLSQSLVYKLEDAGHAMGKAGKWGKGVAGKAGLVALAAGALVAAPFIINSMRNSRHYDPETAPLPPEDPLPKVMDFTPPPVQAMPQASVPTLMGEELVTDGPMARKVQMQRAGLSAGINPGNPGLMDIDGSGQAPQALGRG